MIHRIVFILTILLMAAASVSAMMALHGASPRRTSIARTFFYIAAASFFLSGLLRYYPFGLRDFIMIARSIWGHLYLLVLLLMLALAYIEQSRWKKHWISIAAVALPFMTVVCALSLSYLNSHRTMEAGIANHLLPFHVICAVTGELFFFLAASGSILTLYLEFKLKRKSPLASVMSFPSLESIEMFNIWVSSMAFFLMSVGIVLGIILVWFNYRSLFLFSFKEIVIYLSWLCIVLVYAMRKKARIKRRAIALLNIALFVLVAALFVASNFFREAGFHSFK